jgi:hypothetical protein
VASPGSQNALGSSSSNWTAAENRADKWLLWPPAATFLFAETSSMDKADEDMSDLKHRLLSYLIFVMGINQSELSETTERYKIIIAGAKPRQTGMIGRPSRNRSLYGCPTGFGGFNILISASCLAP